MVTLRPMRPEDLALVEQWLGEPHVARWYLAGSSLEAELEDIGLSVSGDAGGAHVRGRSTTASRSGGASGTCVRTTRSGRRRSAPSRVTSAWTTP